VKKWNININQNNCKNGNKQTNPEAAPAPVEGPYVPTPHKVGCTLAAGQ
jgi:hypothetical protein